MRIGIIGFGYIGRLHATAWEGIPGARVAAVAEPGRASRDAVPHSARVFEGYRALLDEDLDAVSICTPTDLHCEMAVAALERGRHVLLEKPIAVNATDAHRIIAAAGLHRRLLFVGMTHRFYPELREAKQLVEAGAIGSIVMCRDSILEHLGMLAAPAWYLDKDRAGGGVVLTSGIHLIDRLRWFTEDEIIAVGGSASNPYFGMAVEDAAQMLARFRSGITAELTFAFANQARPLVCDLELIGTAGQLTVHTWRGYELDNSDGHRVKTFYTGEPHWQKVLVGLSAEIEEFCAAIREDRPPRPPAEDSVRSLEIIEAFYRAVKSGQMERV